MIPSKFLMTEQPLRTGAMAQYPYSETLEQKMKFFSAFGDEVSMSRRDGGILYVPRGLCPLGQYDDRTLRPIPAINCKMPPRNEEQGACIAKSLDLLKNGVDHILEAPTGWGKTYAGTAIGAALGQATMIVCTKNDLLGEWRKTLLNLIGVPANKIGHVQQGKCDFEDKWFVLSMVHSLIGDEKYPPELWKYFGLVVFDETHKMAADSFMEVAGKFSAKHRLGLSATPKRGDGKDPVLKAHIGEVMVKGTQVPMPPKILVKKTGWRIPSWKTWDVEKQEYVQKVMPHAPGRMAGVYNRMVKDPARNLEIARFASAGFRAGREGVVLMSDTRDHLDLLFAACAKEGIPGEHMGFYVGGMKESALKASANKRVILCTYAMTSEGTNFPHWDTLVLCTPRAKIKQAIGRVMRLKEGKNKPVVLDLVDGDPIFNSFYKSREVEYYSVKAEIVKL